MLSLFFNLFQFSPLILFLAAEEFRSLSSVCFSPTTRLDFGCSRFLFCLLTKEVGFLPALVDFNGSATAVFSSSSSVLSGKEPGGWGISVASLFLWNHAHHMFVEMTV